MLGSLQVPLLPLRVLTRTYSKKAKAAKGVAALAKAKELPVETDAEKLVNFCCINYRIGEEPIPLKPDSEYPDWLWSLRTERTPPPLKSVDPNSFYFWRRVRRDTHRFWNDLAKMDGWYRREHRSMESHPSRYYGDLLLAADRWVSQTQSKFVNKKSS